MDQLIDRLRDQTAGLDDVDLTPTPIALPRVVKRGRRYAATTLAATLLGATAALAAGAVAVPTILEQFQEDDAPVILDAPTGEPGDGDGEGDGVVPSVDDERADEGDEKLIDGPAEDSTAPTAEEDDDLKAEPTDVTGPALTITSPADGATVTAATVTYTGEVEPGSTVTVGPYAATVAGDGTWSLVLVLVKGANTVTFEAKDADGTTTVVKHAVVYEPVATGGDTKGTPTDGTKDGTKDGTTDGTKDGGTKDGTGDSTPTGQLVANQQSSELTSSPYTNVYWGTAPAGAKVAVLSDHGSNYVWANDNGAWEVAVTFLPPPGTTTFQVTVKLYEQPDVRQTFQLTTSGNDVEPFVASQQQSSVPASNPTNTYSGTGEPGHEVWIWTEAHGQWWTTIGDNGTWSITVTFAEVTAGEVFKVKAKDTTSEEYRYFELAVTDG